jgi:ectoine hydroxylase-related dioxygenase (phytanoyl-CoA dioxygenase family)
VFERAVFERCGYLEVPHVLSSAELTALRRHADQFELQAGTNPDHPDYCFGGLVGEGSSSEGPLCRILYTFEKSLAFFLAAANPHLLRLAIGFHRAPVIVTWEDLVVKSPGGPQVDYHQDLLFQSVNGLVFSAGLYLDTSTQDALSVLAGTHHDGPVAPDEAIDKAEREATRLDRCPVRAGNALFHNVLAIHGSPANTGQAPRRVLYLEFRTEAQIRDDSPFDESWLEARKPYIGAAVNLRRRLQPYGNEEPLWADLEEDAVFRELVADATPFDELDLRVPHAI